MMETAVQNEWYEIKPSAIEGQGVYARTPIPADTRIVEYVGERVTKEESLRRREAGNHFVFTLDDNWDLDGDVEWNPARLINHSCAPNCEAHMDEDHIWIVTIREIAPGEELSFNYGYDLEDYEENPCQCGAPNCVGFIVAEEHFEDVRRREARKQA